MNQYPLLNRTVAFIDASSPSFALAQAKKIATTEIITLIDMTSDYNQNRWLGQELLDTLIYFDNQTKLNNLLALIGCIKAPHTIFLSCHLSTITEYFKSAIFLPKIISLSKAQPISSISEGCNEMALTENGKSLRQLNTAKGIVHLIGQRGSGKSTLLGKLIAKKNHTDNYHCLLSSPSKASSKNSFKAFDNERKKHNVSRETLCFVPAAEVKDHLHTCQWIVIDEAATYPKAILEKIINHCQKYNKPLILSTTIEGYEGTGQSYRLNYLIKKDTQIVMLNQPKRFSSNDPLYRFIQSLSRPLTTINQNTAICDGIYTLNTLELREKGWTFACFSLLSEAHYKTTPNDLARFYNEDALFIVYIQSNEIIAALYAISENLPQEINNQSIFYGQRRAKNAFTHQALIHAYANIAIAKNEESQYFRKSQILRISRVAVAKNYRQKKFATQLINTLINFATLRKYDFISTSFSGSNRNIRFWSSQSFLPARIGIQKSKANDEYAILMLYALTDPAKKIVDKCYINFNQHLSFFEKSYLPRYQDLLNPNYLINSDFKEKDGDDEDIESVLSFYRNINWLLPNLTLPNTLKSDSALKVLFTKELLTKSTIVRDKELLKSIKNYVN